MARNSYRRGGSDVPVTDGGTGASSAGSARSNLGAGDLTTAAHGSLDHSAIPGTGLPARSDLILPRGFGFGQLLPSEAAGAPINGLQGLGFLADQIIASIPGSITFPFTAAGLGHGIRWVIPGAGGGHIHSPSQVFGPPLRLVGQFTLDGAPIGTDQFFFGVTTPPTPVALASISTAVAKFGVGFDIAIHPTDYVVLPDGSPPVPTGVPALGPPVIATLVETPTGTWTVTIYDAATLAVLYGPTPFPGITAGPHGFSLFGVGAGVGFEIGIWGVTMGPEL